MKAKSLASLLVVVFLLCPVPCSAEMLPSFSFRHSAWSASDIVVASEGDEIDGRLTVIETWKGALQRGRILSIPELAQFRDEKQRLVQSPWGSKPRAAESARVVSGQRMVLFLRQKLDSSKSANDETDVVWESTSRVWGMRASVVWVEDGKTHAFVQMVNPGPSLLLDQNKSEVEMKREVGEMTKTQETLLAIGRLEGNAVRAAEARRFADLEPFFGQREAFNILAGCGKEGLSTLVDILNRHDGRPKYYHEIMQAIALAAGPQADALFTEMIRQETAFLQERTPTLPKAWWTTDGLNAPEAAGFSGHYTKLAYVLHQLQGRSSIHSREAVSQLKQFLDSLPKVEGDSWVVYLSKACDAALMDPKG